MKMRRLVALGAAASLATIAFVSTATPASAWTQKDCDDWYAKYGEIHDDCIGRVTTTTKKPKTTTTLKATTSTTAAPTTTVVVKPETKPAPVKVKPKFTG